MKRHYKVLRPFSCYRRGQTHIGTTPLTFELADRVTLLRQGFIEYVEEFETTALETVVETRVGRGRGRPRGSKDSYQRKRKTVTNGE